MKSKKIKLKTQLCTLLHCIILGEFFIVSVLSSVKQVKIVSSFLRQLWRVNYVESQAYIISTCFLKASEAVQQMLEQQWTIINHLFSFAAIKNLTGLLQSDSYMLSCIASSTVVPNIALQMFQTLLGVPELICCLLPKWIWSSLNETRTQLCLFPITGIWLLMLLRGNIVQQWRRGQTGSSNLKFSHLLAMWQLLYFLVPQLSLSGKK